ncbi:MAG: hypothetical protein M3R48_04940 [Candidatus Dormibacteraeota bacterium]|nr:hypothetical protein [Candidatus Dormibacteraeota bacterium]
MLETGPAHRAFSGYEGVHQGNIPFAGEPGSINFQGFTESGAEGVSAPPTGS